jgi:hypothetical protein
MTESELQKAVCEALRRVGCGVTVNVVVRKGRRATGGGKGSADLLVAIPGARPRWAEVVWMELKLPKTGRVSPEQEAWHAEQRSFGMRVEVVRSVTEALAIVNAIRGGRE